MTAPSPAITEAMHIAVGHDLIVTFCREDNGAFSRLTIGVGSDQLTVRKLARECDPVADITQYDGTATLRGYPAAVEITVNCGSPQPYLRLCYRTAIGAPMAPVTVPITHEQQDHVLAVIDPISRTPGTRACSGQMGPRAKKACPGRSVPPIVPRNPVHACTTTYKRGP